MRNLRNVTATLILLSLLATGCTTDTVEDISPTADVENSTSQATTSTSEDQSDIKILSVGLSAEDFFSNRDYRTEVEAESPVTINFDGEKITADGDGVTISDNIATITVEGTYVLTGTLSEGQLVIDLADETQKVQLYLDNVSMTCSDSAPINVVTADKVFVTTADNSNNYIYATIADGNSVDGGIFSKCDLTLNGSGVLNIDVKNGDGIVAKDELTITSGTYNIVADGHGMDSNDGIAIMDGTFNIVSGKDGLHSEHSTNEEKGYIYIVSGNFDIDATGDGLDSGYFIEISGGNFDIKTNGGWAVAPVKVATSNQGQMGGMTGGTMGNGSVDMSQFARTDAMSQQQGQITEQQQGQMAEQQQGQMAEQQQGQMAGQQQGQMGEQQQGQMGGMTGGTMGGVPFIDMLPEGFELPEDFDINNPDPDVLEELMEQLQTVMNDAMGNSADFMVDIATQQTADDSLGSMKGLKSVGDLRIYGGTFTFDCYDDAIHSDKNVEIYDGNFEIGTADDGIHANWDLNISGGNIIMTNCFEGLEGQRIDISGGYIDMVCGDDGINAASNNKNPEHSEISLTISGGTIVMDTSAEGDGVDSNGSILITGGELLVSSTTDYRDTALDSQTTAIITGGSFIGTGSNSATLQNFSDGSTQASIVVTLSAMQLGHITLTDSAGDVLVDFEPVKEYQAITISTPDLKVGETYYITAGDYKETIVMSSLQYGTTSSSMTGNRPGR